MSTIQPNLTPVAPRAMKALPNTKCPTPQDVAADLRVQADKDMQRANELKAEAERLRSEGTNTAAQGATTVAEGLANVAGGHKKIHDGRKQQEAGQAQVEAGLEQEQAGLAQEQGGIDAFSANLEQAKELNKESQTISAMQGLGIITEGVQTAQVNKANQTFAQQLEEARGITAELRVQLDDLQTQSAAEAEANNQVIAGNAQFDAGLAQNREGTASLIAGVANQTTAAGKGEKAARAENDGNVFQIHSETHQALSDAARDMAIEKSILAGQEFAQAAKLENKANQQEDAGNNAMSVACLLARAAQFDQEAGLALQQIPGYLAEGNTNLADANNKNVDSENRRQDGLTHLAAAESLSNEANVSFGHGVEYAKESADYAQQSKDLSNQSAQEKEQADAKFAQSNQLKAEAAELQAQGDAQVAQGKKDRLEGSMTAAAGLANMTGGLIAEQQAHDQMNATSANIPPITERMTANQEARKATLAEAEAGYAKIAETQDFLAQGVAAQAELAAQKRENLGNRTSNLADIVAGERQQVGGYKQQHEGMEEIQSGTDQERDGHSQVATGQNQIALGKTKVHEGTQLIQKGDRTGQAGTAYENKSNQYSGLADEVEGNNGGDQQGKK